MSRPRILAALVALTLLSGHAAGAASAPAALDGVVRGPDGAPLAGVLVRLDGGAPAATDEGGRFRLEASPGGHRLSAELAGYLRLERALELPAGGATLELVLEPRARFVEEVVVAAVRAAEDAPGPRSELGIERLERESYGQEMPFLLAATPAIASYSETGLQLGGGYSYFTLRGIGQSRVNMTLDGVPLNDPEESAVYFANFGDFTSALAGVQIERGAGTSAVGSPAYAGAIRFESVAPAESPGGEVDLGGGSYGTARASGAWQSGRLDSGLALWARASWQQTDGWREHSGVDQKTLFLGGDWRGASTYVRFFGFSGREETELAFYAVDPQTLAENPRANPLQPEETDAFGQDLFYLQVARPLGERAEVAAQVYYSGAQGALRLYDDPEARAGLAQYGIDGRSLGALLTGRVRGEGWRLDAGITGYDFARDHYSFAESGERRYVNTGLKREIAGFAKVAFDLDPRWTLFGDLQVRHAEFRYEGSVDLGPVAWTFVDPKLGVRFAASERLGLWASAGTAGREPARNDLLQGEDDVTEPVDLEAIEPEQLLDLELGLDWRGERFDLSAVLYAMEFEDEIAATGEQSDLGYAIRRNLPESYRRGLELEAVFRPDPRWRLGLVASLSRNRIDTWSQQLDVYDGDYGYATSELVTVHGTPPALSPETILGASAEWLPAPALTLALSGRWVDRAQLDNLGVEELATPAFAWFDLAARLELGRWIGAGSPALTVRVNNLLDEDRAWPSGYSYPYLVRAGGVDRVEGVPYYYPLAPRHVVASLELRF